MNSAYNEKSLHHLKIVKDAQRWAAQGLIAKEQLLNIRKGFPSPLYHPNFIIRILIFIATLIALAGVTGFLTIFIANAGKEILGVLSLLYGVVSFVVLEFVFIRQQHHYKSGVTEAILYHSIGFTIAGIGILTDFQLTFNLIFWILLFSFSAFRYLDLIATLAAVGTLGYLLFIELFEAGGILKQIIPIVFIVVFALFYFLFHRIKARRDADLWHDCLILAESLSLLIVYAAGNYLVVRELSISLMQLDLAPGQNIPLAFLFYFLTVSLPILYLYFGIKDKDVVLLRVSLIVLCFSVFTFKFYYSLGHPEITLTAGGIVLLAIAIGVMRYLKTPRHGFTRENILSEKWANANAEAFIISETLGGNQGDVHERVPEQPGGGSFGGGGSTGTL